MKRAVASVSSVGVKSEMRANEPKITVHDEGDGTISIQNGKMDIYVFHLAEDGLRYNGPVNATEMVYDDVPEGVVKLAEEQTGEELVGDTEELREQRLKYGLDG